jgi:hypothetical protein
VKEIAKNKIAPVPTPVIVKVNLIVILVIGVAWLAYSVYLALGYDPLGVYRWIMVSTAFLSGLVCFVFWYLLSKRSKPTWTLAVIIFSLMIIFRLFDQIGWVDILIMLVSAVPLVLLLMDRKWYINNKN